jgi:DNA-directed RNA polymerase specialized sigma24 family protein
VASGGVGAGWPSGEVIAAAQRGDEASIAALVSGSLPHVQRFAFALCASSEDAEDAAQEALLVLFRKIGTLRAVGALSSWMFQIVRHECLRRARVFATGTVASGEGVLIMRDVQGLPGAAVARSVGLSTAAMKSRLHRARAAIREDLADQSGAGGR